MISGHACPAGQAARFKPGWRNVVGARAPAAATGLGWPQKLQDHTEGMSPAGRARWKQEKRGRALRARVQTRCLSLPAGELREELRDVQYLTRCDELCARTSPTICWHVERTPLSVCACGTLRMSSTSCSPNALSRARESEERATDLSVYMPLWAPQEVARTLSASPLGTSRAGAQVVWARTPRGASGRASGG